MDYRSVENRFIEHRILEEQLKIRSSPDKYYDENGNEINTKQRMNALLDSTKAHEIIPEVIDLEYNTKNEVKVIDSLWEDSGLEDWAKSQTITYGASHHIWNIIKNPTYDTSLLKQRQAALDKIAPMAKNIEDQLQTLKNCEKDVAWLFTLPSIKQAYPINTLFPSMPVLRMINNIPYMLVLFHIYRISIMPWFNLISPIVTLLSPWFYLKKLKLDISLKLYLKTMWKGLCIGLSGGTGSTKFTKNISMIVYVGLYIYGIVQAFENAGMLNYIRKNLTEKTEKICKFVATSQELIRSVPLDLITAYCHNYTLRKEMNLLSGPQGLSSLYSLMTEKVLQGRLLSLMRAVYSIDITLALHKLVNNSSCCKVKYIGKSINDNNINSTQIWDMGHVMLTPEQTRNPVSLGKSLIITGPNAAGKTTYVKGICVNYILSQTFGIACARKAEILPVHAIGSFIRISDELGKLSLFESEAKRCAELIKQANDISNSGQRAIYFLDEPMHSTPPIEGTSTSIAVIEHIGKLPGMKLLVTTHYHDIINLGIDAEMKKYFRNISVEAKLIESDIENCSYKFKFPYRIKKGHSRQCIALELLSEKEMPKDVIKRAIEVKNKLYPFILN